MVAGRRFTVRLEPVPAMLMFPLGSNAGLDEDPVTSKLVAALSTSPTVKGIGPSCVFATVTWFANCEMTGASFTALTVTVKFWLTTLLLGWPSLTVTVIVLVPFALGSGAKLRTPVLLPFV